MAQLRLRKAGMPELTPQERLQPALLDRLTDEEPERTQEPRENRVMSKSRLRQAVLRDLAWLFNTTRLESGVDLANVPHARRSVINYGLPALSGRAANSIDVHELEAAIRGLPEERKSTLALQADRKASFGTLIKVMDALKLAGVKNLPAFTKEEGP